MENSLLWTAVILSLAAASLFSVVFSWPDKKVVIAKSLALVVGVVLSLLQFGWPSGLIVGLAAGTVGPVLWTALPKVLERFIQRKR